MTDDRSPVTHPHIGFEREPELEKPRRKRRFHPPGVPSRDPSIHGAAIRKEVHSAVSTAMTDRRKLGIVPNRLLVLEFDSWDPGCRDVFEDRFGAIVVDEQQQEGESGDYLTRLTVQFPSDEAIHRLREQAERYTRAARPMDLPIGMRQRFFNGLDTIRKVSRADRLGRRLAREGYPTTERFYIDVDLWHPGTDAYAREVLDSIRTVCRDKGGRVLDTIRTTSLILARVESTRELGDMILDLDLVARVNLPPRLPRAYEALFDDTPPLPDHAQPTGTEPVVAVIDSGVVPGHPLLRGWVIDSHDFDSGENTTVDLQGHGTQVAGLVVYGDIARCLESGIWTPEVMVANGKVLRRHPSDQGATAFPDDKRPEALVERAIRSLHRTRGCRVFNLSLGNPDDIYDGGRQFAWAELLDQLARELDIVIVVSAGNDLHPAIPEDASTSSQFREKVRDGMLENPSGRICSPGTAAIAVTVGAIARSDAPRTRDALAGAPAGGPSPFSRVGPGYEAKRTQRAVKPEFVAHGGNFAVRDLLGGDPSWVRQDLHLGEPTTRLDSGDGRSVTAVSGTSFAAPQVSNAAARALAARASGLRSVSANVARAMLGVSADVPPCGLDWLRDSEGKENWDKLRLAGYGLVNAERIDGSLANDVCLIATDTVGEDHWHIYALPVPEAFLSGTGARGVSVALAFDPPVRASRKEYLARTMWVEVLKGLTVDQVEKYRSPFQGDGAPSLPKPKELDLRPAKTGVQWSTLQVRRRTWTRAPRFPVADSDRGEVPILHLLVGCQGRFPHGEEPRQRYGIAVRFWHSSNQVDLYQELKARVRARVQVEAHAEAMVP